MKKSVSFSVLSFIVLSIAFPQSSSAFPLMPNNAASFGDYCTRSNKDYAEDRYAEKIPYCERDVTTARKERIYDAYGIAPRCRQYYTIDHFIPLALGGSNADNNLWPEAKALKHTRQDLEVNAFHDLQAGKIDQKTAIEQVVSVKLNPPTDVKIGNGCD